LVRLNRIYTRTGDAGTSGLVDGSRLSKADVLFTAIGDVDEANSAIGCVTVEGELAAALLRIQNDLFDLGADLATPGEDFTPTAMTLRITPAQVSCLEAEIDAMNDRLEPLRSFILPGGAAASIHLARAIARRAERSAVAAGTAHRLNPEALRYLNRLSDWLFVAARIVNLDRGGDPLWVPGGAR
jgi:cob(I)alamin adenosyltransferase